MSRWMMPSAVRHVEGIRDLHPEIEDLFDRQRLAMNVLPQRLAVDELHGDEWRVVLLADVVDGADAGMIERGRRERFSAKAFQRLRVLRHAVRQKFQGDRAVEPRVDRFVDDTHSASTEFL